MATEYYKATIKGLHQTQYNECDMYFRGVNLTANDYMVNAADLRDAIVSEWIDQWAALFPASYEVRRIECSRASPARGGVVAQQYDWQALPGSLGSNAASQQLCPVVRLIPPTGTKTAGKIFLPCIAEDEVNGNKLQSSFLSALATLMNSLIGGFSASAIDWKLFIYSRKNNSFAEALAYDTSPIIGFQRRRQRNAN